MQAVTSAIELNSLCYISPGATSSWSFKQGLNMIPTDGQSAREFGRRCYHDKLRLGTLAYHMTNMREIILSYYYKNISSSVYVPFLAHISIFK